MAGDDEAAAAILGMIETYGTAVEAGTRLFWVHVTDTIEHSKGVNYWLSEYDCVGHLPGSISVVRDVWRGKPQGDLYLKKHYGDLLIGRAAALVKICEKLLSIREDVTRQIDAIKAEVASLTAASEDVRVTAGTEG